MGKSGYLAFDIGAESGRAIWGELKNGRLLSREVYRFPNRMIRIGENLYWDVEVLFREIKAGMKHIIDTGFDDVHSVGIDTWGVDFGLFDKRGILLSQPFAYRDGRNAQAMRKFLSILPEEEVYARTGIQFMQFNSLFQLQALRMFNPGLLEKASKLLFIPDIFHYYLCGTTATEFTFATTSQLYNPLKGDWDDMLLAALHLPRSLLQPVIPAGTVIGRLKEGVARETGMGKVPVTAVATHDTGSAVAAVPAQGTNWAFISSGTWSIMGAETHRPIIDIKSQRANFTNEGGIQGTFRFSKNIMGLWLLQECRRTWKTRRNKGLSYSELVKIAEDSPSFRSFVDPDWHRFLNPPDMPEAISTFCRLSDQPVPRNPSEFTRIILEGLAFKYRVVLDELREVLPDRIEVIHIIGGGARNTLLCQFTADATGLPVISGPAEATAVGNIMVQAMAHGEVSSQDDMRAVIRSSSRIRKFFPEKTDRWEKAYREFKTRALPLGRIRDSGGLM